MNQLDNVLSRLNDEQRRAALSTNPVLLALAGAGSGKTSVLTARIANLQLNHRIGTSNMLCLTFTRLAAGEMKTRVAALIGEELARNLTVGTFHSFCVSFLRQHAGRINREPDFSVYDEEDRLSLLYQVIKDLRYHGVRPEKVYPWGRLEMMDDASRAVVNEYRFRLSQNNAIDLEGLLVLTFNLLKDSNVAVALRDQYTYVFVDEYQDTDPIQDSIITLIKPRNLFVVGDPAQAIYGWRGADIENILTFEHKHRGLEVIRLEQNYRSTNPILNVANRTLDEAEFKSPLKLWTDKQGVQVTVTQSGDEYDEAVQVARQIRALRDVSELKDIAVLCRTNRQVDTVHATLHQAGIDTFVVSNKNDPLNAFDSRRMLHYMTFACNPLDERALYGIINWPFKRMSDMEMVRSEQDEIMNLTLPLLQDLVELRDSLQQESSIWSSAYEMFTFLTISLGIPEMYKSQGLLNRENTLKEAARFIERWVTRRMERCEGVKPSDFLQWVRTRDIQARLESEEGDGVRILTVHAAKGLEWDHVFIVGCNENVFPSRRGDMEEERRLFYVAVTRARETLYLSYTQEKHGYNDKRESVLPSRFLEAVTAWSKEEIPTLSL